MCGRAQWVQSYVTDHHIFCVYLADDPETIREHARCGRFPVTTVRAAGTVIDPLTGAGVSA
jgi:Nickel responsive protein SCO4226-like